MNALRLLDAKWLLIAGLNLAFGLTLLALDPERSLTQYGLDRWGAQNGLPQDKVQAITQTADGYLWIGTLHGLAKFDGVRFTRFIPPDAPELETASVHGLYTARDGSLWIGTDFEGLAHWKDGRTEWYRSQKPFATELRCIREDRNGAIWITAQEGVFRVADHRLVPEALNLLRVFDLAPDPNGGVWVGAERGLFHVPGNGRRMDPWEGASGPAGWIFAVLPLADGTLWAGGGGGLAMLKHGRWTTYSEKDGLPNQWVRCLLKDSHGSLWAGTFGGLARFSRGSFESLTVKDGLSDREVGALFEDREGSLWIGTRGGGMTRLRDVPAVTFNLASGNTRNPTAPFEDAEGRVWSGTDEGALLRYRNGEWTYHRYHELANRQITSLAESGADALMMVAGDRLFRLSRGRAERITLPGCPRELTIIALAAGTGRSVWIVGAGNRLFHLSDGHFDSTTIDGKEFGQVEQLFVSPRGGLWAISSTGVLRLVGAHAHLFWRRPPSLRGDLLNLAEDSDGSLWVGSEGNGILHLGAGRFRAFTRKDGLPDDNIMDMLADDEGNLWIGSQSGIFRVSKSELKSLSGQIHADSFTTLDGLASNSFEVGNTRGACRGSDGKLWFASSHGLTMLDPQKLHRNKQVPNIIIEHISIDGKEVTREHFVSPPGNGQVIIRYAATSLLQPLRVRFRYKLEGFDKEWSQETSTREVTYTNLPPARYAFRVKGSNNDGLWNPNDTAFAFEIRPRFYQTWWFETLCALAISVAIWCTFHLRVRRLRGAKENLDRVVEEQTGLLQEANQKLVQLSRQDGLTGVANRRHFDACLDQEFERSGRSGLPLSLLMVDIDYFKVLNDTLGHPKGDECLARLATILKTIARRESDLVARYGGEEFGVILPGLEAPQAIALAEDILAAVRTASIANPSSSLGGFLTVSVGVATVRREQVESARSTLLLADAALYQAKRAGRNRAEVAVVGDILTEEVVPLDAAR